MLLYIERVLKKMGLPWRLSGKESYLPVQGTWIYSLGWEESL